MLFPRIEECPAQLLELVSKTPHTEFLSSQKIETETGLTWKQVFSSQMQQPVPIPLTIPACEVGVSSEPIRAFSKTSKDWF